MTVQCLNQDQKNDIFNYWFYDGDSKAYLGRKYNVSTRTITRVITEIGEVRERDDLDEVDDLDDLFVEVDFTEYGVEYSFIMTPDSISITRIGDEVDTVNIDEDHEKFEEAYNLIVSDPRNQTTLAQVYSILDIKTNVEILTSGRVTIDPERFTVSYSNPDGSVGKFSGRLVDRIINGVRENKNIDGLIAFANNLTENPSNRAVNELYDFLEASDIEIDEDGMVVCFKRVRDDYYDVYSGTFDNSPGTTPSVPRNMVDENSEQTCSYGLHVCSKAYLPCYSGPIIVKVLVHPADFVSIPKDYYGTDINGQVKAKARVCKYTVVEDVTDSI